MFFKPFAKIKSGFAIFACGFLAPIYGYSESLSEIYELAKQNDAQFKVAQANLQSGLLAVDVGRSALLPQISAVGVYSRYKGTSSDFTTGIDADVESTSTSVNASLNQPLFNAASWYDFKRSGTTADLSEVAFSIAQQELILRTAQAYLNSLQAVDNLETALAEENALSHSLEQTKQRFEVGLTAITEVHEAQAEYDSATANRLISEGNLVIAFEALEVLTGQAHDKVAPLKSDFPVTPPTPLERSAWVEMAVEKNLDLKTAELQLVAAEQTYKIARSAHLPTLSANISYGDSTRASDEFPADIENDGTTAALTLNVPIFSGGGTSAVRKQAAYQKVAAKDTLSQIERSVIQQTRSFHQRVTTGVSTIYARKQAIISGESALEATKAGYDVGTRNLVNVLDAQRRVYDAKRNFLSALYDYILSGLSLKQAAGILNPNDLAQLDKWLNKSQPVGLPIER
jgi:outer membrane protein